MCINFSARNASVPEHAKNVVGSGEVEPIRVQGLSLLSLAQKDAPQAPQNQKWS